METAERTSRGAVRGSDAVGARLMLGDSLLDGSTDGVGGNEGKVPVGVARLIRTGADATRMFMATNTPAMPVPMMANAGTASRAREGRRPPTSQAHGASMRDSGPDRMRSRGWR